jgi:signal transduction histidine kinase
MVIGVVGVRSAWSSEAAHPSAHDAKRILLGPFLPHTWRSGISLLVSLIAGAALVIVLVIATGMCWVTARFRARTSGLASPARLAGRLAEFDRWRVQRFAGARIDPGPAPEAAPGQARRLAAYQFARLALVAAAVGAVSLLLAITVKAAIGVGSATYWVHPGPGVLKLVAALSCFLAWPQLLSAGSALDVMLARALLGPSRRGQMFAEIGRLAQARALAVESAESQRRRIERDLHDGIQPRLVSLALELGLARARFERDPGSALALIEQAHEQAKTAIRDLRDLVRGIHPSVLDERGLDAALSALVASCAVPVSVEVDLPRRPGQAQEAVAYYVAAEGITNVTKHSFASSARVTISQAGQMLNVSVTDDGHGGAIAGKGGGLAGLAARVAAVDGTFILTSPAGGPTAIEAVIPCEP